MFLKWFTGVANGDASRGGEPFWVDWDWLYSYSKVRNAYTLFTAPETYDSPTIYSSAAWGQLATILCREGLLDPGKGVVEFDFINSDWSRWQALYHTQTKVEQSFTTVDGLMAAMGAFSLRASAAGKAEWLGGSRWRVTVTAVAVFARDSFNFEEGGFLGGSMDYLGGWSCEKLDGAKPLPQPGYTALNNSDFRNFRFNHGMGNDFFVLSQPHFVENFAGKSYEILCNKR